MTTQNHKRTSKDAKGAIGGFMAQSDRAAVDRFAVAERVTSARPTGLSPMGAYIPHSDRQEAGAATRQVADGGTVMAPIKRVKDNPFNARQVYKESIVKERAASLAKDGQMQPAPACLDPDDPTSYILIGGHYRKRGLLLLGKEEIELKLLHAPTRLDLYRLSFTENHDREDGTPLDNALAWQLLLDEKVVTTDDEIAASIGLDRATVNKTRQILQLPAAVLDVLKGSPEKFTLTAAYELQTMIDLMKPEELVTLAKQIASEEGLSTRELAAIKARLKNPPQRKTKETSRQHKIVIGGNLAGHIKEWDSGRVELDIHIADQAERERLVHELRRRFGIDGEGQQTGTTG